MHNKIISILICIIVCVALSACNYNKISVNSSDGNSSVLSSSSEEFKGFSQKEIRNFFVENRKLIKQIFSEMYNDDKNLSANLNDSKVNLYYRQKGKLVTISKAIDSGNISMVVNDKKQEIKNDADILYRDLLNSLVEFFKITTPFAANANEYSTVINTYNISKGKKCVSLDFQTNYSEGGAFLQSIIYCENELRGSYDKIEDNWYYRWQGLVV